MLPSCLWFLHCLAGPHTPSICSLTVRRTDMHLSPRMRAMKRWKGKWEGVGGWGVVRKARKLSPLCNLCIFYRILLWRRSTFFTVPHCVLSCKTRLINKSGKLRSQKLLKQLESVMSGGGGLINHICSCISKEGSWWGRGGLSQTSLTALEH